MASVTSLQDPVMTILPHEGSTVNNRLTRQFNCAMNSKVQMDKIVKNANLPTV